VGGGDAAVAVGCVVAAVGDAVEPVLAPAVTDREAL
jgi:hypothetical protein